MASDFSKDEWTFSVPNLTELNIDDPQIPSGSNVDQQSPQNSTNLLGKTFDTYQDVQSFALDYEKQNYVQLNISHSRTIESARKRGFKNYVKEDLLYTEVTYQCIHGRVRSSRSTGKRPAQSTYRQQCPFIIRLKAKGGALVVVEVKEDHNHCHSKETNSFLPRHRLLEGPSKEFAKQMLKLRADKKLLQVKLHTTLNKSVTLRDLHNLASIKTDDSLGGALNYFIKKEDATVELVKNDDNVLLGIFYQDTEMSRIFNCYPEVLFVDVIHKVSDRRMPLYILLVEDGNGDSEIVGFYLVTNEEKETMKHLPELLKKHNSAWKKVQSIRTDKDFVERHVFKEEFPNAKILICLFHCLRTFRREITSEKMGITSGERGRCLKILQKLTYSNNESDYQKSAKDLEDTKLKNVIAYFKSNWDPIRDEWVVGLQQSNTLTFGNRTNNRLEAINSKVVQVVKRNSKLTELFQNLDDLLLSLRTERNSRVAKILLRVPINSDASLDEQKYMQHLTPHSYSIVSENIRLKNKVDVSENVDGTFSILSKEGNLIVTSEKCECSFFKVMQLPCHHLLRVRELKDMHLFSENLCAERWTKTYYINSSRLQLEDTSTSARIGTAKVPSKKIFSQNEKYKIVFSKVQKLASLASESPSRLYPQRLKVLSSIIEIWEKGCEVAVNEIKTPGDEADGDDIVIVPDKLEVPEEPEMIQTEELVESTSADQDSTVADNVENEVDFETIVHAEISTTTLNNDILQNLPVLPPKMKKRGRPKGSDLTVIGLPCKRKKSNRVVAFERKDPKVKEEIMLKWFVSEYNAKKAVAGSCVLDEEAVEQNPNLVSSAILDENVCISALHRYFTADAWMSVQQVVEEKKRSQLWLCTRCNKDLEGDSICCNSCLEWIHLQCANLKSAPKKTQWFCRSCNNLT